MAKSEIMMTENDIETLEDEMLSASKGGQTAPATPPAEEPATESSGETNIDELADEIVSGKSVKATRAKPASDDDKGKRKPAKAEDVTTVKPPPDFVPQQALHAERAERKKLEERLRQMEKDGTEREARLAERMSILAEALKGPEQPKPGPDEDVIGYAHDLGEQVKQLQTERAEERKRTEADRNQQAQRNQLLSAYRADAQTFAGQHPDWNEAYQFALRSRDQELELLGYTDPADRARYIEQDEINIAMNAFRAGKSPAEAIYGLAKMRGFAGGQQPATPGQKLGNGSGTPAAQPSAEQRIQSLAKAQEATMSLSRGGGSAEMGKLTPEALDRMPQSEFDALVAKVHRAAGSEGMDRLLERMMGLGGK